MSKQVYYKKKISNWVLLPIMLMIGFIPVIVHMYQYNSNLSQFDWFPVGLDSQTDFFFGWKMIAIILVGVVMVGALLYRYFKKKEEMRFEISFYFLFFYGLFVVMSALFSGYKYWVVRGTYELLEPVWCVLAYILVCYYAYQYVREEKQLKVVLLWSGIGVVIVTAIGVFQYWGMDFFRGSFGKHLITNPSYWNQLDSVNFEVPERVAYSTLYNQNFLSFYFGIMIPLVICLIIATKKWWVRILLGILEVGCLICLKGCNSDSGWMALLVGGVIAGFVLLSRKKKTLLVGVGLFVVGCVGLGWMVSNTTTGQNILSTIIGTYHLEERVRLDSFETNNEYAELNIDGNKLRVSYMIDEDQTIHISCKDERDNDIKLDLIDSDAFKYQIDDSRFENIVLQPIWYGNDTLAVVVSIDGQNWSFAKIDGQGYYFYNYAGKLVKWEGVKGANLFKEDALSCRGHIWNMTIPLLGKHVFIGSGANTYIFEYPQDDYIGQQMIYANGYEVKAHCWYLQQWVETGLVGTLAMLIFVGWYIVRSIKIYRRVDLHESLSWIGFGLFAAVLVYLIAGIANDSNVCTAPVFWGMLGLGMATNRMLVEKEKLFVKDVVTTVGEEGQTETLAVEPNKKVMKEDEAVAVKPKQTSNKKQSRKQRKNQKK